DGALDLGAWRQAHLDALGGAGQPVEVLVERVGPAAEGARHLVDRVAVEEAAVEHRHACRLPRNDGALDPDAGRHARYAPCRAKRIFHTMVSASTKILRDIFDFPTRRSANTIGNSTTR